MDCSGAENETETERHQSSTSFVWIVVLLLTSGVTVASVVVFFCCCCYWQRRRWMTCCDVMVRRDVTGGTGASRDILQSIVAPPLRKRILFMRDNILYASGTVPTAKVCPAVSQTIYLTVLVH